MTSLKASLAGSLLCAVASVAISLAVPAGLLLALAAVIFVAGLMLSAVAAGSALRTGASTTLRGVAWAVVVAYVGAAVWLGVVLSSVPLG